MTIDRFPCLLVTFHDYQVFLASTFPMIQPEFLRGSYGAAVGAGWRFETWPYLWRNTIEKPKKTFMVHSYFAVVDSFSRFTVFEYVSWFMNVYKL